MHVKIGSITPKGTHRESVLTSSKKANHNQSKIREIKGKNQKSRSFQKLKTRYLNLLVISIITTKVNKLILRVKAKNHQTGFKNKT